MSSEQHNDLVPQRPAQLTELSSIDTSLLAGQLTASSIAMYQRDFAAYLSFAGSAAAALDPATLARWRAELARETRKSPNTINRMLSAVKRLMKEAAAQGYLPADVAERFQHVAGVKPGALKERLKPGAKTRITPAAMRKLCSLPDTSTLIGLRDAALLATMASSGLRVAEVASLTVGQLLQVGSGYLVSVRGKNDSEWREAPLSREAYQLILRWIDARGVLAQHLFTSFGGRGQRPSAVPLSPVSVWRTVQAYAERAGLAGVKPHDFRRFVGTQLAAKGDIRKAQKALGHKRIDTTAKHYVLDELEPGLTDELY